MAENCILAEGPDTPTREIFFLYRPVTDSMGTCITPVSTPVDYPASCQCIPVELSTPTHRLFGSC
ncbi:hypothetical protein PENANT_c156G08402 [Penicillium antarcticum]|uniref:Uncharacterized protein n=1 Tax=Penicillium antarcticum TaxID=416450 RepID=A0A1V6PF91_9EURO|nr:hypothetical protein PENANT_c156G08402 [Penicillium antarcticum]